MAMSELGWPLRDAVDGVTYILLVMRVRPCTRHLEITSRWQWRERSTEGRLDGLGWMSGGICYVRRSLGRREGCAEELIK